MPQLRLFGRRWAFASGKLSRTRYTIYSCTDFHHRTPLLVDVVPAFAFVLFAIHLGWTIAFLTGTIYIETTGLAYECAHGWMLRLAVYSLIASSAVCTLNEAILIAIGLRGGPLETHKRKRISFFLYVEVFFWLAILLFTIYGTYVALGPTIDGACWSDNPCLYYSDDVLPLGCKGNSTTGLNLDENCSLVFHNRDKYLNECFLDWSDYAATYAYNHYDPAFQPPFNNDLNTPVCNNTIKSDSDFFIDWSTSHIPADDSMDNGTTIEVSGFLTNDDIRNFNAAVKELKNLTKLIYSDTLTKLGLPVNASEPWVNCTSAECRTLEQAALACDSWDVLLKLPENSSSKTHFVGLIITSWCVLAFTAFLGYFSYNAFQDLDELKSWEGMVVQMSKLFCCSKVLKSAKVEADQSLQNNADESEVSASKEIARSMKALLGGIDLDPTDRILAAVLVAERQSHRRKQYIHQKLAAAGFEAPTSKHSLWQKVSGWLKPSVSPQKDKGNNMYGRSSSVNLDITVKGGVPLVEEREMHLVRHEENAEPPELVSLKTAQQMNPKQSPFEADNSIVLDTKSYHRLTSDKDAAMLQYSVIRLASSRQKEISSNTGEVDTKKQLPPARNPKLNVKVETQRRPVLTPAGGITISELTGGHMCSRTAAPIYLGRPDAANLEDMAQAQCFSRFALSSYGLQHGLWLKGKKPATCQGSLKTMVKCCSKPLRLERRFRKRNFISIVQVTQIEPADLLFVSYTNVSGGIVPYLIALHQESKSIVISVRGTVSHEDLITDLLSNPVAVDHWLPEWVKEENSKYHGGDAMYAHTGVLSSASAILKDLERNGLLYNSSSSDRKRPVEQQVMSRNGAEDMEDSDAANSRLKKTLSKASESEDIKLSLTRAQNEIYAKLEEDWKIVLTGHSLGAAISSLLTVQLRQQYDNVHCWAFNPPGGLYSANLSAVSKSVCTAVVVGKDIISRLSFTTAKRMVDEMTIALARCKYAKLRVFSEAAFGRRVRAKIAATFCAFEDMGDEALELLEKYYANSALHAANADTMEMFPPGRLIYLRPFNGALEDSKEEWDAIYTDAQALMGEGILLSPAMMSHHKVYTLFEALDFVCDELTKLRVTSGADSV